MGLGFSSKVPTEATASLGVRFTAVEAVAKMYSQGVWLVSSAWMRLPARQSCTRRRRGLCSA